MLSKATNPKCIFEEKMQRLQGLINLLLLQQYNKPSFLTGVEIILSQVICFLGNGGNIPYSLCIQNVQGISLRTSE